MKTGKVGLPVFAVLLAASIAWLTPGMTASQGASDPGDIHGVVSSANGPEAGVWVIAETTDLSTKFVKTVVTGDGGRYLVPDLPDARYKVWVRGYGLVDSTSVDARPGDHPLPGASGSARELADSGLVVIVT